MAKQCYIDFETRGVVDLRTYGSYIYSADPQTDITCIAFTPDDLAPRILVPRGGRLVHHFDYDEDAYEEFLELIEDETVIFVAHGALFEQDVWRNILNPRYKLKPTPPHRWKCTMAKAAAHGLPLGLEEASRALMLDGKHESGYKAMLKLSSPIQSRSRKKYDGRLFYEYDDLPEEHDNMYKYCGVDTLLSRGIDTTVRDLSELESQVWQIDQRINQGGLRIDTEFCKKAVALDDERKIRLQGDFSDITDGIGATQRDKVKEWLEDKTGQELLNMKRGTLETIEGSEDVQKAIYIYGEFNRKAVSKYRKMLMWADNGGIVRNTYAYHGAHTGRWAGRGPQFQNLARPEYDIDLIVALVKAYEYDAFEFFYSDVNAALGSGVRGAIIPRETRRFMCGDFAQMEARVLAFLAGDDEILELFRRRIDTYIRAASIIYGKPESEITKAERQTGKVSELALGFGGSISAYANMAFGYSVDLGAIVPLIWNYATEKEKEEAIRSYQRYLKKRREDKAKGDPVPPHIGYISDIIKQRWRAARPITVTYWNQLESAAVQAVLTGKPVSCGTGTWFMYERFLFRRMASGRVMAYPYPKLRQKKNGKFELSYRRVDPETRQWVRHSTYGGQLAENETQALQRDLLSEALVRLEGTVYNAVMHTHDEILVEVVEGYGLLDDFQEIMAQPTQWSGSYDTGIPIDVDTWEGYRYRK